MMKTYSTESLSSIHQQLSDSQNLLHNITNLLNQSYGLIPAHNFNQIFINYVRVCTRKAETENLPHLYFSFLVKWIEMFKGDLQSSARSIVLQIICKLHDKSDRIQEILNKVKLMVIDTPFQFLLIKILLLQAKFEENKGERKKAQKCLRKCITYSETYALEYLKSNDQIRRQLTDYIIISYFQLYRITKDTNPKQANQTLIRAYNGALKNYGDTCQVTQHLNYLLFQQHKKKNISCVEQASTIILTKSCQKNILKATYFWQQQIVLVQLLDSTEDTILSESKIAIKLNFDQIKKLKSDKWIDVDNNNIDIIEEQITNILIDVDPKTPRKNSIQIKNIDREMIIKKDDLSSSDNSDELEEKILPQPQFLRSSARKSKTKQNN